MKMPSQGAAGRLSQWLVNVAVRLSRYLGVKDEILSTQRAIVARSLESGGLDRAEVALRTILRLAPEDVDACFQLANVLREKRFHALGNSVVEDWLAAAGARRESLRLGHIESMLVSYVGMEQFESALKWYALLCQHIEVGSHYRDQWAGFIELHRNRHEKAEAHLRAALDENPEDADSMNMLAMILIARNQKGEAITVLERATAIVPGDPWLYTQLVALNYYKTPAHPHVQYMINLASADDTGRIARRRLHFMLGQVFDQLGMHDRAFAHFRQGNDLDYKHTDISGLVEFVDASVNICTPDVFARFAGLSRIPPRFTPVFIVGMPRSGSTLVEQILATHPDVIARGEDGAIAELIEVAASEVGARYPGCVPDFTGDALEDLARRYAGEVAAEANGDLKPVVVDKQLYNMLYLAFVACVFPNARIIYCRRNALDVAVSCYFQNFLSLIWMEDLKTIAAVYRQHERIMDHWRATLPLEILEVPYENLVSDAEAWTRRILRYCGLEWHSDCLQFYRSSRIAWTASQYQVKSPIYASSVERWRRYERHLGALFEVFGDPVRRGPEESAEGSPTTASGIAGGGGNH